MVSGEIGGKKDENVSLIGNAPVPDTSDPSVPPNYIKITLGWSVDALRVD
jgi:hypothetical protein